MPSLNAAHAADKWAIVSKGNISIKTHGLSLSALETEITDLESRECDAVRKRDTLMLMRLWSRDFTLQEKQDEIINSKNGLPNYISLTRMIETITILDNNTVSTSGFELFREIRADRKSNPEETRKYFHIWTRKNDLWKLTTKRAG
ncbi:nuclear transport factor 2 family protein [Chryseolinea lacunae]|uniref:Nuclear transport factor 2 family protein n=1 Tax=Chryseolinea lacunae TaxID=2801331 RepID=A0ABS1KXF7_9BACT|nr:nuclear transport factor 2 family protein [Chryseolinea lacunae]MBL0742986.1 nuclear transport factor 2 family protein [Chryseolinea lacunae]